MSETTSMTVAVAVTTKGRRGKRQSDPSQDDWHSVTDARKRKQIQDRLAQRARRKRLAEAKLKASNPTTTNITSSSSRPDFVLESDKNIVELGNPDNSIAAAIQASSMPLPLPSDQQFLPNLTLSLSLALYSNGVILGLSCAVAIPTKSRVASPDVPASLQPTVLQLTTTHFPLIDRYPFPNFRDNMITYSAIIDEEEFVCDLLTLPSFHLRSGGQSWDPAAWTVEKDGLWMQKWGFLLS